MPTTRASYSQYVRPKTPPKIAPTGDDNEVLLALYRLSIVDAHTFRELLSHRSKEHLGRRLNRLWRAGYILRLPQQEQRYVPGGGSLPLAYVLGNAGAAYLKDTFNLPSKRRRDDQRISRWSVGRLPHELELSKFMVRLRKSAEARDGVEYLNPDDHYRQSAPHILERSSLPQTVKARVNWFTFREEVGTNPDGFALLRYTNRPEGKNKRAFFVELDMANMTINPNDKRIRAQKFWSETSILKKDLIYGYAYKRQTHKKDFGLNEFERLMVTTTPARVKEMQKMWRLRLAIKPHQVDPNLFLYTDFETIKKHGGDILATPIENARGEVFSLAP